MGNCVCHTSRHGGVRGTTTTGGAEPVWASSERPGETTCEERKTKSVKVTVRISKSRLQKLMASGAGGGGEKGMTLGKVLAEIVSGGAVVVDGCHRRRRWKPALESIPEEAMESS